MYTLLLLGPLGPVAAAVEPGVARQGAQGGRGARTVRATTAAAGPRVRRVVCRDWGAWARGGRGTANLFQDKFSRSTEKT